MKRILLAAALLFGFATIANADGLLAPCSGSYCITSGPLTDGQLPIGSSSDGLPHIATITAGANITVTNGHGTITISGSGGGGSGCVPSGLLGQLIYNDGSSGCSSLSTVTTDGTILTIASGDLALSGSSSGNSILNAPATGGGTSVLPAGSGTLLYQALADGDLFVGSAGGVATAKALSGDCTLVNTGAITCTKTNGVAFAASATTDTTDASNISSGTLAEARGGAGTISGLLKANGSGVVSAAVSGTDYAPATSGSSILLGSSGGFANYAGASCTNQFIRVLSAAGAPTCASVANADLTNSSLTIGSTSISLGATASTIAGLTSLNKVAITAPATGSTLTIADGKTLTDTSGVGAKLLLGATGGGFTGYAGVTCTNQFIRVLDTAGAGTCATVGSNDLAASLALVTPSLGVATATSINKVAITAPASSATLTIANAKTLTASNTLTFTGTDGSSVAFGTGGTISAVGYSGSASDLASGTVAAARGGAGTINGALKGNGSGTVSQAACADLSDGANTGCSQAYVAGTSFTPTFTSSGTAPTGVTYSTQTGRYLSIGKLVWMNVSVTLTSKGTGATGIGRVDISASGVSAANATYCSGPIQNATFTGTPIPVINGSVIQFLTEATGTTVTNLTWANYSDTSVISVTCVFEKS